MQLQLNPNDWSCLATAFSMALDIPLAQFIDMVGHDGSQQPYRDKRFYRGFHLQECIDICFKLGFACTEIQYYFGSKPSVESGESVPIYSIEDCSFRFVTYLGLSNLGVITGVGKRLGHAVAWDGKMIYDPRGHIYSIEEASACNFHPQTLWMLTKMELDYAKKLLEG